MQEFRVERSGFDYRCPKPEVEEVEDVAAPVDSKDLFREASSLPSSDDLQINFGRFLHHYRNTLPHYSQGSVPLKSGIEPAAPVKRTVPSADEIQTFFAEIRRALGVTTTSAPLDPSKVVLLLKKAIQSFESSKAPQVESKTVLESFDGYVDSIDGDTAYVTLESRSNGDILYGEYSAQELLARGIHEQTRFLCETVKGGGAGRVHFAPLPKIEVTDEEARAIAEEMREAFPGGDDSVIEY
ncbi:hypothetical protein V5E97_05250 [Singulisphaera sp. Ch08]|uniref:Uncharacterized protein n=1 Tax=Singulisphaera sp. Ch08 TaxID=3120278 RepID=A0AAU7CJT8_9BACT